jgi:hypothetical protein
MSLVLVSALCYVKLCSKQHCSQRVMTGMMMSEADRNGRGQLKCDGTRTETRFRLSAKRTSLFKLAGASVHSTTGSRGVRISRSKARHTMFRGSVKGTSYPLHSPVSPSLPLPCVTVCHHISTGLNCFSICSDRHTDRQTDRRKHSHKQGCRTRSPEPKRRFL